MESTELLVTSIKMVSALALVLGLVILAMHLLKKVMNRTTEPRNRSETIGILSVRYLGGKNSIALVNVAGQVIVVGISPSGMSTLARIDDPDTLNRLNAARTKDDKASFAQQLSFYTNRLRTLRTPTELNSEKNS